MRFAIASLVLLVLGAGAAQAAEAVTYSGSIGSLPVILELTSPGPDGVRAGRYAYLAKGGDIPLHGLKTTGSGSMLLSEEKPCTEKLCKTAGGDILDVAPIAASWNLHLEGVGERISGTWQDKASGKSLPVKLMKKGQRQLSDTAGGMLDALDPSIAEPNSPIYDVLKMERPLKQGSVADLDGNLYRMDEDSRTGLSYPVFLKIGNIDPAPLNRYLARQRLQLSLSSFRCMANAYLGFGWSGMEGEGTTGYGEGVSVQVEYLSTRLIEISETGSYWCGGPHPDDFNVYHLADPRTGEALVPEQMLKGWVATKADGVTVDPATVPDPSKLRFGPSEELIQYVIERRKKFEDDDEKSCAFDDYIRSNFAIYFKKNAVVFTLKDMPHALSGCSEDLLEVPLKEARPLLTAAGAGYFEILDR